MLSQGALDLVRPCTSYELLVLGADGVTVGLMTAWPAVVPLVVALAGSPTGSPTGCRG